MSNLTEVNIHAQVRVFVTMLCEGFNVPSSETKIQAFADKLKHPHVPALRETYNIFTDGRASTTKMPTIAEVMEVYRNVEKRHTKEEVDKITHENIKEVDYKVLKAVVDTESAMDSEAIYKDIPKNMCFDWLLGDRAKQLSEGAKSLIKSEHEDSISRLS